MLNNLLADIPGPLTEELIENLVTMPGIRIERIISWGQSSMPGDWYDQETHEWVLLMAGTARLTIVGSEPIDLRPGSFVNIPAHRRHRVEWTDPAQPTIWLAVHYEDRSATLADPDRASSF